MMTKRILPLILLLLPATVHARPFIKVVRSSDFHPNANFVPIHIRDAAKPKPGNVEQQGEVIILEGDDALVSTSKDGFGIVFDNRAQNPVEITNRVYTKYGDDFDEIVIFTTFDDTGAAGAAAYEVSTQQDTKGIGQDQFDDSAMWGSTGGHLHAFVNMMKWDQFVETNLPLTDPRNYLYPVLGQEFAHRWLAFLHYKDSTGVVSTAMLGRDAAHWASTLQADGSVMDGNLLSLDQDGYYETSNFETRYSTLDLYGMGLIPASDVQPWFLLTNVVTSKGRMVNPAQQLPNGAKLKGNREDITIDQVLAAEGPRVPAWDQSSHSFRIAFVLLTRPGQRAAEVVDIARTLEQARQVWEAQFKIFTNGHGNVCTQVSAPCGVTAAAHIDGGEIVEHGGNGNGIPEPGEPVLVTFHILNDSQVSAREIAVAASGNFVSDRASTVIDQLAPSQRRDVVFAGTLPADAVCGESLTIDAASTVDGHTFRGFAEITPGVAVAASEGFEQSRAGWAANPDGKDSAIKNGWAYGTPKLYRGYSGWIFQPAGCHESQKCWFTGLEKGHRGMQDSSLEVGESHLYSRSFDLSKTYLPTLNFWAWFQAIDFSNPMTGGVDAMGVSLLVEGSTDGGKNWVTLDTITSSQPVWQPRSLPLDGVVDTTGSLLVRLTASNPVATTSVEAGLDDLQIQTLTAACNPNQPAPEMKASGCSSTGRSPMSGLSGMAALLMLAAVALLRRRAR